MQILVTGAAGFIGSHLTERLLADGHGVVGFDSFTDTYDPAVKRRNIEGARATGRFELIEADIRDAAAVDAAFANGQFEAVIHLAALAGVRPSLEQPALYNDVNVTGTANLLEAARKHGVARFLFGSSSSVYGNRPDGGAFAETDRVDHPISPYAMTKRAGELLAYTYWHAYQLPVVCLRFFTVFGPRQRPDLAIHKFMRLIAAGKPIPVFGDGSTQRDYTYVADIVDGVCRALAHCNEFDIFNLGSHHPVTLAHLIESIERVVGRKAIIARRPMQTGDVQVTYADVTHSHTTLGYAPATALDDGLRAQWQWVESHL
ncbi:MAG: NAD-dependent epimerase/dehydratase family protein [Planctomycetes bacterium]|nr:NAD-dependent epimerase/dehydratase family protein [Planctomycetota bacterium]